MQIDGKLSNASVGTLAVNSQNPNIVYAGARWNNGGVYRSVDGGIHWILVNNGLNETWGINVLIIDPQNPSTLYAGASGGVYKSTDGGDYWTKTDMRTGGCIGALALAPENPQVIFAGTCAHISYPGIYKSVNGSATWTRFHEGLLYPNITALAVASGEDNIFAGTHGAGVFKSSDGGRSWNVSNHGITSIAPCHHCVVVDSQNPSTIYVGTFDSGVFKSTDGGLTWVPLYSGLRSLSLRTLAMDPQNHQHLFALTNYMVYESVNGGEKWRLVNSSLDIGDVLSATYVPTSPPTLFVGTKEGVFKSQDGGHTWSNASNGLDDWVWNIAMDPADSSTLYAGGTDGVYKSVNGGNDWRMLFPFYEVYSLAIDPENTQRIYVASNLNGIFRSEDGGNDWKKMSNGLELDFSIKMTLDPSSPNTLYVTTGERVYRSDNRAQTWSEIQFPLHYQYLRQSGSSGPWGLIMDAA